MTIIYIILFFIGSFALFYFAGSIYFYFHNNENNIKVEKFLNIANELNPIVFNDIKLRYWKSRGTRTEISINSICDLYLYDESLVLVRRQNFILKMIFAPVVITSNIAKSKNDFPNLESYLPSSFVLNSYKRGELEIKLQGSYRIDITLKGLTTEQIDKLRIVQNWCQKK